MYYTDARDQHYGAGVPRDLRAFFARLGGLRCTSCGARAAFSTLNEYENWDEAGHRNPMRCALCQHYWFDD